MTESDDPTLWENEFPEELLAELKASLRPGASVCVFNPAVDDPRLVEKNMVRLESGGTADTDLKPIAVSESDSSLIGDASD